MVNKKIQSSIFVNVLLTLTNFYFVLEELVTDVEVLVELPWCQTDNFYMNIGGLSSLGLVACGDDEGNIYMYLLPDWLTEDVNNNQELGRPARVAPLGILPWPHLEGVEPSSGDIMMDKVVISPSGNHLVAVTNNNIVAIWKKVIQP